MLVTTTAVTIMTASLGAAGCSSSSPAKLPPVNVQAAGLREGFGTIDRLVAAAQKERHLTLTGISRDRVGFGEIVDRFSDEYGIDVRLAEPGASSGRQIETADTVKPDVFNLSMDVAVANTSGFAPYKVTGWRDLPDDVKEPGGAWYAAYGGYMSIGYDSHRMATPASYADLLKPGHLVALPDDPLHSAAAFSGVMATSLLGGLPAAERGIDFFTRLKRAGVLTTPDRATVLLDWDYRNLARAEDIAGWQVVVPSGPALAAYYMQAINKDAPHPAAARLWQEFLYSDEGQNLLLKAHARPARLEAMRMRGTVDAKAAAALPKVSGEPVILTIPQADEAKTYLRSHWPKLAAA